MGTRADFYVGRGETAEWLGSIGWDGYPSGIDETVFEAAEEPAYRTAVAAFFAPRDDVTLPHDSRSYSAQRRASFAWAVSRTENAALVRSVTMSS